MGYPIRYNLGVIRIFEKGMTMMTQRQLIAKMEHIEGLEKEASDIQDSPFCSGHWRSVGRRWDALMGQSYDNGEVVLTEKAKRHIKSLDREVERLTNSFAGDPVAIAAWEARYGVEFECE